MGIIPLPNQWGCSEVTAIYTDGYVDELSMWLQELLMIGWFWDLCKGNMLHDEVFLHLHEWMSESTHILTQGAWANIAISPFFYQIKKWSTDGVIGDGPMSGCPMVICIGSQNGFSSLTIPRTSRDGYVHGLRKQHQIDSPSPWLYLYPYLYPS